MTLDELKADDKVNMCHCDSCDEYKNTHEICMDCIGDLIKQNANRELIEAMEWFCGRVDKGEVRSKVTYAKFKELINKYKP